MALTEPTNIRAINENPIASHNHLNLRWEIRSKPLVEKLNFTQDGQLVKVNDMVINNVIEFAFLTGSITLTLSSGRFRSSLKQLLHTNTYENRHRKQDCKHNV